VNINEITVTRACRLRDALTLLDRVGFGILLLVNSNGKFERTVTDGDLRRLILASEPIDGPISALPRLDSIVVAPNTPRSEALRLMNQHLINHLPIVDEAGSPIGILERRLLDDQILLSTPHMGETERHFVEEAFRTNWIAPLGPNVDAFERELAEAVTVGYAAALSSGTAALHVGLRLLDVSAGDKVFCSTFTFAASANPIVYQNAEPVFIDCDTESWNMSPIALERAFETAKAEGWMPRAVVVVNLYGQSADMDALLPICNHYGVPVLEDAAESLGATYKGRASGTFGKLAAFSFNGNKIITTSGGGMLVSEDERLIERARFLSTQARDPAPHYQHSEIGYNYRMSNILAGVGRGQLKVLGERIEARRAVYESYVDMLSEFSEIEWMPEPEWSRSNRWLTTCTVKEGARTDRTAVINGLAGDLIEARPLWKPMHLQPVFEDCRYFTAGNSSVSDDLFHRGLCLPSGSNLTESQMQRVAEIISSIFRR
jgi:dTDP-4-amino-4,6-dideoxygalactose transaminase